MIYAIYNYTNYTGDYSYIEEKGIDVIVEVARFWASRVHYAKYQGQYMIHGVTGPNEYDNNVNNNWYTNYIAKWCLEYAVENINKLQEQCQKAVARNNIKEEELVNIITLSLFFTRLAINAAFVNSIFSNIVLYVIFFLKYSRAVSVKWSQLFS